MWKRLTPCAGRGRKKTDNLPARFYPRNKDSVQATRWKVSPLPLALPLHGGYWKTSGHSATNRRRLRSSGRHRPASQPLQVEMDTSKARAAFSWLMGRPSSSVFDRRTVRMFMRKTSSSGRLTIYPLPCLPDDLQALPCHPLEVFLLAAK